MALEVSRTDLMILDAALDAFVQVAPLIAAMVGKDKEYIISSIESSDEKRREEIQKIQDRQTDPE